MWWHVPHKTKSETVKFNFMWNLHLHIMPTTFWKKFVLSLGIKYKKYLQLYSGDYVLVWGEPDEDGWVKNIEKIFNLLHRYESHFLLRYFSFLLLHFCFIFLLRYVEGELLDGRRGLIPSNYVTKLVGCCSAQYHDDDYHVKLWHKAIHSLFIRLIFAYFRHF